MTKYKVLSIIYLFSVLSISIANWMNIDVQSLYRVPFINIRWIDVAILSILIFYIKNLFVESSLLLDNKLIISLCFMFLIFQIFQLISSWGIIDKAFQISWFLCTLNIFILIDLLSFKYELKKIIEFLNLFLLVGTITLIVTNFYLFYSFIAGKTVFQDLDIRVAVEATGTKETVSTITLMPFVYISNLYFVNKPGAFSKKALHITSLFGIFISLVVKFARGDLVTIFLLTIIYFITFSKKPSKALSTIFGLGLIIIIGYFSFGSILREKSYDPIDKLSQIINFSTDINNPDWDKGRHISREYALSIWEKNIYTGVGYVSLYHYGMPEDVATAHNFIVTSLFHNGVIGTLMYVAILFLLFMNLRKLWRLLSKENKPENDLFKILIISSIFWLIPFWTQEVLWEKYSLAIQFIFLGLCANIYLQKKALKAP